MHEVQPRDLRSSTVLCAAARPPAELTPTVPYVGGPRDHDIIVCTVLTPFKLNRYTSQSGQTLAWVASALRAVLSRAKVLTMDSR